MGEVMEIDGRHCLTYEQQFRRSNIQACRKLLDRLRKYHGEEPEHAPVKSVDQPFIPGYDDDDLAPTTMMVTRIQQVLCKHYKIKPTELMSKRRTSTLAEIRQLGYYFAHEMTSLSLPAIGRRFGKDHSTIHHAIRKIERLMSSNPTFEQRVRELENRIRPAT
jgi:chromosomal replication initiation ATPase DnaA